MNGVLKTQAQYYNDPVTYTGEGGTETNKAVIEDIYDLCAWHYVMSMQPDIYAVTQHKQYAVMVNDVNFNNHDTMSFGITDDTLLDMNFGGNGGELDGAGHSIFNMVIDANTPKASSNGIVSRGTIRNVNFKNIVLLDSSRTKGYPIFKGLTMRFCNISAYISAKIFTVLISNTIDASDCTFNIGGAVADYRLIGGDTSSYNLQANRCLFNFSNLVVNHGTGNILLNTGRTSTFSSCAFTGLIYQKNVSTSTVFSSAVHNNCYFAIMTGITEYTNLFSYPTYFSGMTMVDIDLLTGTYADGTNYMCVHTVNLKNKDFLQQNGFITL